LNAPDTPLEEIESLWDGWIEAIAQASASLLAGGRRPVSEGPVFHGSENRPTSALRRCSMNVFSSLLNQAQAGPSLGETNDAILTA
jgi:hypothetical protein